MSTDRPICGTDFAGDRGLRERAERPVSYLLLIRTQMGMSLYKWSLDKHRLIGIATAMFDANYEYNEDRPSLTVVEGHPEGRIIWVSP